MIRLTLLLAFCIWLVFALGPEPAPPGPVAVPDVVEIDETEEIATVTLETGEVWEIDRVIAPGPVEETAPATAAVGTGDAAEAADAATDIDDARTQEIAAADILLLYVTGTRVNLRAGPSTDNPIVTALTQGTATEFVAEAPDGWFEIRDPTTGSIGFMSGDFLSPTPP